MIRSKNKVCKSNIFILNKVNVIKERFIWKTVCPCYLSPLIKVDVESTEDGIYMG